MYSITRAGPVEIGAVLEDGVDERVPEERIAAHDLHPRGGDEFGDDRVGDLVLDEVGAAALPLGEDDHLRVGEVGQGVERRVAQAVDAAERERADEQEDHELVARAPLDDPLDERIVMRRGGGRGGGHGFSGSAVGASLLAMAGPEPPASRLLQRTAEGSR